ncbi:MAG TPA: MBL fold metallo-hydrolase [Candidatus Limnocylindrales bacterium]|nr:MBL fold metallo-hydrolase [Candidatus Limnocylindrales bacterium]
MDLRQFVVPGLGHISALVADETQGIAAVVDPRRDVDVYLDAARERGLRISHVAETHLHNDYVSGARELVELTGARHVIGAGADLAQPYQALRQGDAFDVGSIRFTTLETPGHTPEHVCYAVADRSRADEPLLMFTGGSLLVGAVGRTDLLGAENAESFARQMHASLHERILPHPDHVAIYPTHGGGSLCSKSIASTPWSTLGYERRHDGLLAIEDVETFVRTLLADQPAYPRYFARMRPINQQGPRPIGRLPEAQPLPVDRVRELLAGDHLLVDLRSPAEHILAHVPGSISIPAGSSFGTWLGWVVPHDRPLILLLASTAEWDDAVRQALRIGYEGIEGYLHGGFEAWQGSGGPVEASGRFTVGELHDLLATGERDVPAANGRGPLILDVRQRDEFERAHIPGSVHLMAGDLPERLDRLPRDRPIVTICASGYRSSVAASLLRQAGFERVGWVSGGVPSWRAAGYPVERGTGEHVG